LAVFVGVARKEQPFSRMVETDTASRKNRRPDGVIQGFQIIADAIEPAAGAGNLFAKDDARPDVSHEAPKLGPPISRNCSASRRPRERLTRTRPRPGVSVAPSGKLKRLRPSADPREEMALVESLQVVRLDVGNAPLVDFAIRNLSRLD
jgi:hypothetical protein